MDISLLHKPMLVEKLMLSHEVSGRGWLWKGHAKQTKTTLKGSFCDWRCDADVLNNQSCNTHDYSIKKPHSTCSECKTYSVHPRVLVSHSIVVFLKFWNPELFTDKRFHKASVNILLQHTTNFLSSASVVPWQPGTQQPPSLRSCTNTTLTTPARQPANDTHLWGWREVSRRKALVLLWPPWHLILSGYVGLVTGRQGVRDEGGRRGVEEIEVEEEEEERNVTGCGDNICQGNKRS